MGQHGRAVSLYLLNGSVTGVIKYGSSALCVKNGKGISGTPVQSSSNPA